MVKKTTTNPKKSAKPTAKKSTPKTANAAGAAKKSAAKPMKKASPAKKTSSKASKSEETKKTAKTVKAAKTPRPLLPLLSSSEQARRNRHEAEKKRHEPTDIEIAYGNGRLPVWSPGWLLIQGARQNNLRSIDVPIPLSALTAVTGVSGSGKSSLVEEVLYASLARTINRAQTRPGVHDRILGIERLNKVIRVDQQPLGQTPSSNPATYTGVFDLIRSLYARLPESKMRGWTPRRFSFNAPGGRCEKCEGAGQLKIEMHFLADVWIECDACNGRRYDAQTLEVLYKGKSIADVLEMSCAQALALFANVPAIARILRTLCDVGLDYIALGQSATTLSGGEAQRVKLAAELARPDTGRTLYILDEPTTGLHFDDLRKLLDVLHRLVDLGNTVVVIEHNLDIIKSVDWVIDLGPEAGLDGGRLVFAGIPEELAEYGKNWLALPEKKRASLPRSYTAEALLPILASDPHEERKMFDAAAYQAELEKLQSSDWEEEFDREIPMPWESDGRSWHTKDRRSRSGQVCKWDGRALGEVIDKIEDSDLFAETDWNNRSIVEVRARKKSNGWFFHAITGEEWLLKMKFRVPKNSFRKEELVASLNLRPLNEMEEIPLYGTQNRTRVELTGPWQEVEVRVHRYDEIDTPAFWNFLDEAIAAFGRLADSTEDGSVDLTPWKTLGRLWHFTPGNCYGGSSRPQWPISLLERLTALLSEVAPNARAVWTNKIIVPFYLPDRPQRPWAQLYTKNAEFVCLQLNTAKNLLPLGRLLSLGGEPEVDGSNPELDVVYLRFRAEKELDEKKLEPILRESLEF